MSEAVLEAAGIVAAYGNIRALHGVDISVTAGTMTAIVGANGAGKTTLLRALIGAHRPSNGTVRFRDEDITRWPAARRVAHGLVLVPEGRGIIPSMSVSDNLRLGLDGRRKNSGRTLDEIFIRFPVLGDRREQAAGLLSGGEQQMLAIGRALLSDPVVLMLDEPSLGLSPKITLEVFRLLAGLRDQGLTVLLVEQNVRQALKIADQCYLLEIGRVVGQGDPRSLAKDNHIREAYLGG